MEQCNVLKKYYSHEISCEVIPYAAFLKAYQHINDQTSHSAQHDLLNRDFAFGKKMLEVLKASSFGGWNLTSKKSVSGLKGKFAPQLADVVYSMSKNVEMTYNAVFSTRVKTKAVRRKVEGEPIVLSKKQMSLLVEALNYYNICITDFAKINSASLPDSAKGIIRSASFFGLILVDYLGAKRFTNLNATKLAQKIHIRQGVLAPLVKGITNGSDMDKEVNVNNIVTSINHHNRADTVPNNIAGQKYVPTQKAINRIRKVTEQKATRFAKTPVNGVPAVAGNKWP